MSEKLFPKKIRVWAHDVKDVPLIMLDMFRLKLGHLPSYKTNEGREQCRNALRQILEEGPSQSNQDFYTILQNIDRGPFFDELRLEMLECYRELFANYIRWVKRARSHLTTCDVSGVEDENQRLNALACAIFDDVFRSPITFEGLWDIISTDLRRAIEESPGLGCFAANRAKFEGWLKVELCGCLSRHSSDVVPEKGLIDVVVDDWAIELKTINTNYRCDDVVNKGKPITKNVASVISDIQQLRNSNLVRKKAVVFVVFPLPDPAPKWPYLLRRITDELAVFREADCHFSNGVRGLLYLGLVDERSRDATERSSKARHGLTLTDPAVRLETRSSRLGGLECL